MLLPKNPDGDYEGNELTGANSDADQGSNTGKCYVLSKVDDKFGFFLLQSGVQTKAHKAYLIVEPSSSGSRGFLGIGGDDATGIVDANYKFASQDGRITNSSEPNSLQRGDAWYSLDGRRLTGEPARKGVYILNGKLKIEN